MIKEKGKRVLLQITPLLYRGKTYLRETMTVGELINKLSQYDPRMEVITTNHMQEAGAIESDGFEVTREDW